MMTSYFFRLILILCFAPVVIQAQINNCVGGQVVCSSADLGFNPQGPGFNDYADPDNDPGCMVDLENHSAWYYFEINQSAPPGLSLGFTILPNGGLGEDYDWALYGPDVFCQDLGYPLRCSSSSAQCDFCPSTGMGMGTTDISEGPGSGDGFVMPIEVQPGQGFFLMIDNWYGTNNGFVLTWTGPAAEYLNCDAEIPCGIVAEAGPDILTCGGDQSPIQLDGSSTNNHGTETYSWAGTNGGTDFLSDPNIPNPTIQLPVDFSGSIIYTLTVKEDSCRSYDHLTVIVSLPEIFIDPVGPFCENAASQILSASPAGGTWGGAVNGNMFDPAAHEPGIHTVTYTYTDDNPPCTNTDSIHIEVFKSSGLSIALGQEIIVPLGENSIVEATFNVPSNQIDTVVWSPDHIVECLDPSCINVVLSPVNDVTLIATAYDLYGCTARDTIQMVVTKDRKIYMPNIFSPNNDGINDLFYLSGNLKQIAKVNKFAIYNRWGSLVYEAHDFMPDDVSHAWDGNVKEQSMSSGVFLYVMEVEFIDGWVEGFEGDVTVIR